MALDIKAEIEKIVDKIKGDKKLQEQFKSDPVKAVESLIGVDLPDDVVEKVTAGVKTKMTADAFGGLLGKLKKD